MAIKDYWKHILGVGIVAMIIIGGAEAVEVAVKGKYTSG